MRERSGNVTEKYSSIPKTREHIKNVSDSIHTVIEFLKLRAVLHDMTKLAPPELEYFDKYTPMLKTLTYGSDEYKQALKDLKPALDHHYAKNRHHPEYFENGIDGMNLVDIIEMFSDWFSAVKRMKDGDIYKSIDISAKRFNISPQLVSILKNSVELFGE